MTSWLSGQHNDGNPELLVCRPRPRVARHQDRAVLPCSERHESVICRPTRYSFLGQRPWNRLRCLRRQKQCFAKVLTEERCSIGRRNARVTGQTGNYRVGLNECMTA